MTPWTTHELSVLRHFAGTGRHWRTECATALGRTVSEVKGAIERQRMNRMSAERNYKKWDAIDDETILRLTEQKWQQATALISLAGLRQRLTGGCISLGRRNDPNQMPEMRRS